MLPDDYLLGHDVSVDVRDRLALHCVPMYFFRGEARTTNFKGCGSGVLVKIGLKFFILTAGHCVVEAGDMGDDIVLGVLPGLHTFKPRLERRNFVLEGPPDAHTADCGYFEVPPADAVQMEAAHKVFLSLQRVAIATADELTAANDWMVVAGYPRELLNQSGDSPAGIGFLTYTTTIAATGDAPSPPPGFPIGSHDLLLWVPDDGNVLATDPSQPSMTVPVMRGSSGGGCWIANFRNRGTEEWSTARMRLVGTHQGSLGNAEGDASNHRFARELLLRGHLELIARDFEDLRDEISEALSRHSISNG